MVLVSNKNIHRNYEIIDEYECGIVLTGTEVKSLSHSEASINDAYVTISKGEIFVLNMHIKPFKQGNIFNVDPYRTRKLLLHQHEINKLAFQVQKEGLTLVPVRVYWKHNYIKLLVALVKGKKLFDKREDLKKRDISRQIRNSY